ncbi:4-hydroxy-tetrahydrodipicolinate synthase [Clostridium pascui]|uniref:dihydrodipicolinate synthase family protein n=1 Tax=Clostridium pascui TaxID=46609 RepID=UPI001958D0AD|nr:dihydrodipicolinate synthase family protein [Clostridium pascui]MBM7871612.1 4-hydroxy-tetrahydrodipicolinate synthase [Clostridium pascui]
MINNFPGGVWPVMLTPFTKENKVDYKALEQLVNWYIDNGVLGLFAVCQSSEMFFLSLEERVKIACFVKEKAAGRVPVIASGHVSDSFEDQVKELNEIAAAGVDATILITNRLAKEDESDEVWLNNLQRLLEKLPEDMPLGFYECPYPYKRVMTKEVTRWCAETGRFYFLKDTSCDMENIKEKLEVIKGTNLKLYNANTSTLLESLKEGAAGYSGVMANMQPKLYVKVCNGYNKEDLEELSDELTICSLIERQYYPVNAKYYLELDGLDINISCRTKEAEGLTETFKKEVKMLKRMTEKMEKKYL